jgi:hypothetical protein
MILVLIVVLVFVAVGVCSSSGSGGGIGISVCTSTIHVGSDGEQKTEKFHTDSLASLYTDTKYFCARHNIYDAECELIREYHMKRCFTESTGDSDKGDGENEVERSSDVETGVEQGKEKGKSREKDEDEDEEKKDVEYPNGVNNHNQPIIKEKPKSSGESTRNIVDYSQSYGPVLPVTHLDKTHQLKMYVGEIPSTALKRFCGMLKLDNAQCKQVKLAYFELCQGEKYNIGDAVLEEELSSHFSGSRKVDKFSTGDNSVSSTVDGVQQDDSIVDINSRLNYHDDHPTWLKWVTSKCAEYWNFVALIIVILYLATENLP